MIWLLNFIPTEWLQTTIYFGMIFGIILVLFGELKFIPLISTPYFLLLKWLGILIFVVSIYFEGSYGIELDYKLKMQDLENKIKIAEQQSADVNQKLNDALKHKTVIIKERVNEISKNIQHDRNIINSDCKLNDTAWMLYNSAVTGKVSTSTKGTSSTSTKP